ncbi:lysophospholipid acyltransferase family protein [Azospira restricta]|uniref:1-acyl-sn-glycerol-3-phosphate acyltransferase n=1 Tax=Azospira restricta TaxID=404405 RepID=A0A974SP86_9RHOO|nr:lysophospholipid acyltransferase family protein [Azospira restricta]QRJ63913.1 1-acyl-sn-glycerol-3-phosphate acyltransferase [Azospira restricta]
MTILRSSLFMLVSTLWTMLFGSALLVAGAVPLLTRFRTVWYYRRGLMWMFRRLLGITWEVRGRDNLPAEPSIILAKHQSAWETVALQDLLPERTYCVFVLKKELMKLPFFGWGLSALQMISIDRSAGREALNRVVEQGADRLARGFWIIIFPEGTRVAPGETRRYKQGGAYLAAHTGARVVPVAHNAGEVWPRNAFLKRPGHVVVSIGPAIDTAGLSQDEINARTEAWIEAEMRRLSPHRYPDAA